MIRVPITPTERRVLITHSKHGANDPIRSRALALLLHAEGQSCAGIAAVVAHVCRKRYWYGSYLHGH